MMRETEGSISGLPAGEQSLREGFTQGREGSWLTPGTPA